nr:SusC/RagA family TonB-linked outer membrane protein [uncultured Pedobacter sp.]
MRRLIPNSVNRVNKVHFIPIFVLALVLSVSSESQAFSSIALSRDTLVRKPDSSVSKNNYLNDKVPVLYGEQSKGKLIQSVGVVNGATLEKLPVAILQNSFAGQLAGLYASQSSGLPGSDASTLTLRGHTPLILIDGVPRDISSINPEQVESVTILKDALSTAMLGIRGMNGAILITTRKKAEHAGTQFSFTAQAGLQTPIKLPKTLSSYNYAKLYNEALVNDGQLPIYTQADLDAYQNGTDPLGHPNINWYNTILKKNTDFNRYTLNAAGDYSSIKYFVSLDKLAQDGLLKENEANAYKTNSNYNRYTIRTNLDIKLDKNTSASLNILGSVEDFREPGNGSTYGTGIPDIFGSLVSTPNNAYPVLNPDGSFAGNLNYRNNIYAQSTGSGYRQNNERNAFIDLGLKRNLDNLVSGLWAKASMSFNTFLSQYLNRQKQSEIYGYSKDPLTGDDIYNVLVEKTAQANGDAVGPRQQQTYAELSLGYDHNWKRHGISFLLLGSRDSYQYGAQLDEFYQNIASRLSYSFNDRYLVEFAGSYSGNNRYKPGQQYGFFPSVGIAWNVHNENFFKNNFDFINRFKIRASFGTVGNSNPGYYTYIQNYVTNPGYMFSTGAAAVPGIANGPLANPYRTWEKSDKFNIGADIAFSKNRASINLDYFKNREYDLLQVPGHNSALLGTDFPEQNIGINQYHGIELNAGWKDRIGKVNYYVSGNLSTIDSKVIFGDEVTYDYPWQQHTGTRVDQQFGYIAEGFYDASNVPVVTQGYQPIPGDIRYKDLNQDGLINSLDQTAIGSKGPLTFYGASLGFQFKGFDFSALFQGVVNRDILTTGRSVWAFQNDGKGQAFEHNLNRWTPETATTATYPRLSIGTNSWNERTSTFWLKSGDYMRLKNMELGYTFTQGFLTRVKMQSLRLFVNGVNLFTISDFKNNDPESFNGGYPIQRVINGGISVKF